MSKRPRGLSDATLLSLWRRVVLERWFNRCVVCGSSGPLEAHHIVHRRVYVLRYDPANGMPVCPACHISADTLRGREYLRSLMGDDQWDRLLDKERVLKRDEMAADGLSDAQWRSRWKRALEEELRE